MKWPEFKGIKVVTDRIQGIDGQRGVFTLIIIACHVLFALNIPGGPAKSFIHLADLSVEFFFCVSGMLVYGSFHRKSVCEKKPLMNFYLRRSLRILPLWWALLFFLLFRWDALPMSGLSWSVFFSNAFFYFGFLLHDPLYLPVAPAWTLFVEETFYCTFPLVAAKFTPKRILPLTLVASLVALFWLKYAVDLGVPEGNYFIQRFPIGKFRFFFLGIAVYHLMTSGVLWDKFREGIEPWLDFLMAVALGAIFFRLPYPVELLLFIFLLSALIPGTFIYRFMNQSFFRWIGVRCYGFYLLHTILIHCVLTVLGRSWPGYTEQEVGMQFCAVFVLVLLSTAAVAGLSFRFLEKPCMDLAENIIRKREDLDNGPK